MNARQAARAAAKRIEELEHYQREATADIKAYNGCIQSMIKGGSPCDWCEEQVECQKEEKAASKGCKDWWLAFREKPEMLVQESSPVRIDGIGGDDESERVFSAGSES